MSIMKEKCYVCKKSLDKDRFKNTFNGFKEKWAHMKCMKELK